ncbi:MAG TPA: dihydrolipoamide acetyltransferase family protein [Thermoleophilaceae bacterium]|nr:dihydrolipoamide acetyltransferase family protein [Thermoleophilaceae bacterium]
MATEVVMPRLSDSMEEGTVLKWLVQRGGEVKRGQPLVEIETDKANMTYDADSDGVLVEILAQEGETLEVGKPIARIGAEDEAGAEDSDKSEEADPGESEEAGPAARKEAEAAPETQPSDDGAQHERREAAPVDDAPDAPAVAPRPVAKANGGEHLKASPVARRMAGELGVELARVEGSGPGGRVVKADVEAAAKEPAPATQPTDGAAATSEPEGTGEPAADAAQAAPPEPSPPAPEPAAGGAKGETTVHEPSRLQRTVSRRMAESKATVPDFSLELDIDMTLCIELRERLKAQTDRAPSYNDMVVKAAALALRDHPRVNGAYRDGRFESYSRVNVGVAVAARDALVVPVIHDADQKSLGEISRQGRRLIERVRDGEITPPEVSGGTFTVSNLGMYGIERFTAIVNPPQAAILTVGALKKKPAVDERGRVVARDLMTLTLVCDHRILYGADGAQFLAQVRELLEQPLSLAL